jgi:hypothetical protein
VSSLDEFAEFTAELVLDNGRKIALYPEQKLMLSDHFDGVRETLILVSKNAAARATARRARRPRPGGA